MANEKFRVIDLRHPSIAYDMASWDEWRECYETGYYYIQNNLVKFSERETDTDFYARMDITPVPAYAKSAINDVRNAIYQRMGDVIRRDGSPKYMRACEGELGGVDMNGTTMNAFMGIDVLTELLVMGKCGIYIDMPKLNGASLADVGDARPYVYRYKVEDILSWSVTKPEEPTEFQAVLLRDKGLDYISHDLEGIDLPAGEYERYRLIWINKDTGYVNLQFYDINGEPIDSEGNPGWEEPIELQLRRIPFIFIDIGDSLLKDITKHQAALLNLSSSDVSYALKANFPFYTEQGDLRAVGDHLKHGANPDGTATEGGQRAMGKEISVGATQGRMYDIRTDRPGFIHPSSEPLEASIKLQEKLEDDIRKLINLAVQNKIGTRVTSAEALKISDQGIEAGLAYIGLILENGERKLADYWAAYEELKPEKRQIATIKYPDRYSLKTDEDRITEAAKLSELMFTVPGKSVKKEIAKNIVTTLLGGKVNVEMLDEIFTQIDKADYATSNPDIIIQAKDAGLVGEKVASVALGFSENEYLQAREDHAERVKRVKEAQTPINENAAARGVPDLSAEPVQEGKEERAEATDTTMSDETKKPVRGKGK